jgi:hypothetical protein
MCRRAVLTELTEQREKELKTWVDGIPEGDVCNGTAKTAQIDGAPQVPLAHSSSSQRTKSSQCMKEDGR